MGLRELTEERHVHILYTTSNKLELYVYDKLKEICEATLDSVIEVNSNASYKEMMELIQLQPFMAARWLFVIDYKKMRKSLEKDRGIFSEDSSVFLIKTSSYKEFKEARSLMRVDYNELYLQSLSYKDAVWLLSKTGLDSTLIDFTAKTYRSTPEKILSLLEHIESGEKITDRKAVISICGNNTMSMISYAISLLNCKVTSEKGIKMSLRKAAQEGGLQIQTLGIRTFRGYLLGAVRDILAIKEMYLNGDIYNKIRDVPDCFDEKRLSRYNYYLETIKSLNISRVIGLYVAILSVGRWYTEFDFLEFLYNYYNNTIVKEIS